MQMCHFHQAKTARRYITKKLRLQAEKDLKKIIYRLKETNEKNFTKKLNEWEAVDKSINQKRPTLFPIPLLSDLQMTLLLHYLAHKCQEF